ncbi:hypothetical protein SLA2020_071540 [Shorea laevis]
MAKGGSSASAAALILNIINSVFTACGIAISLYALYSLVGLKSEAPQQPLHLHNSLQQLLLAPDASIQLSRKPPRAWFIYFLLTVAASLFVISFFGYVGSVMRNPRCLGFYSVLLVAIFLAQVGAVASMFLQPIWDKDLSKDKSSNLQSTSYFLKVNWKIIRWLILAVPILEVIAFLLVLYLRSVNKDPQGILEYQEIVYHDDHIAVPVKRNMSSTAEHSTGGKKQEQLKQWLSPLLGTKNNRNTRHN